MNDKRITILQDSHRSGTTQGKLLNTDFQCMEIREKQGFFNQNQGKNFQIRENFQHLVNRSKVVDTCILLYMAFGVVVWGGFNFWEVYAQQIVVSVNRTPMVIGSHICLKNVLMKTKKKSGKTVRKSGESQGISRDKKWEPCIVNEKHLCS